MSAVPQQPAANDSDSLETREWLEALEAVLEREGATVVDRPISVPDFLGTVCTVLGVDYKRKNRPPGVPRPIPIVDTSKEIKLLLAEVNSKRTSRSPA